MEIRKNHAWTFLRILHYFSLCSEYFCLNAILFYGISYVYIRLNSKIWVKFQHNSNKCLDVLGVCGQVLVDGALHGMASLRSCTSVSPWSAEPGLPLPQESKQWLWNGFMCELLVRTVSCGRHPVLEQGKDSSLSSSRNNIGWTDHNHAGPHSLSPCTVGGEEVEPGKEGRVRERCFFKDVSYFSLFCSLLIISSLLFPDSVCFVCDIWWLISLYPYISSWTFHYIFFAQSSCRGKWQSSFCGCLVSCQGQDTPSGNLIPLTNPVLEFIV